MRENEHLYTSSGSLFLWLAWCLFATTLWLSTAHAQENLSTVPLEEVQETNANVENKRYSLFTEPLEYDSVIQRSNFLALDPRYHEILESATDDRRSQFFWKLRFDAQSIRTEGNIQSHIGGANFVAKYSYKFLETLHFRTKVSLNLESGRTQGIFGDQEPGTGAYPREALIDWTPFGDAASFKFGLIQQRFFNEQLFISKLPFLGASQAVQTTGKRFAAGIRLQQLIPTSYTISTRVTQREEIPYFNTQSLEGKLITSQSNFLTGRVTRFEYQNLPAIVAYESFIYGNTVTNTDVKNAQFIYQFEGWMTQLAFEQKLTDSLATQIQWNVIKNEKAPDEAGEAQSINAIVANDFGRWIGALRYKNYFIESDAVPAAYNSHVFGHNNRIGQAFGFRLESKDWGVHFVGDYVRADLLNQSSPRLDGLQQDNQQTIYFAVETMYDFI